MDEDGQGIVSFLLQGSSRFDSVHGKKAEKSLGIHRLDEPDFGRKQALKALGLTTSVNRAIRVVQRLI